MELQKESRIETADVDQLQVKGITRRTFLTGVGAAGALSIAAATGVSAPYARAQEASRFTAGTYTGSAQGMYGTTTVEVTVDETSILSIEVIDINDTDLVARAATSQLPNAIVEAQSLAVDNVAGATISSTGIRGAVQDALEQAGADIDALNEPLPEVEREQLPEEEFDVVIVGAGGAGMAAAIQIGRTSDCSVLILEKEAYCGGSTALSGGQIAVAGTSKNEGDDVYDFNADEFLAFFKSRAEEMERRPDGMWINEDLVHAIGERVPSFYNYLMEEGIDQPDHENQYVFDEDNRRGITGYKNAATRGQEVFGRFFVELAEKNGVEIRTNAKVTSLVVEGGAVAGVNVETPSSVYAVRAKKVILTTGGFAQNRELFEEQNSYYENIAECWSYTAPGTTGDAFEFCAELDPAYTGYGFIAVQSCVMPYGFESPQGAYPTFGPYLWVDHEGSRFVDETEYYYHKTFDVLEQPDGYCWALCCGETPEGFYGNPPMEDIVACLEPKGGVVVANTVEELADKCGFDMEKLTQSIAEDDERVAAGTLDTYGFPLYRAVGDEGPYYAFKIVPSVLATFYGFKLDERFHVLNNAGEPIANLFAAGELTMGNYMFQEYFSTSCAIACGVYGGSIAGDEAVAEIGA